MAVRTARVWLPAYRAHQMTAKAPDVVCANALTVTQSYLSARDPGPVLAHVRTLEDGRPPGATPRLLLDALRGADRGDWR